MKLRHPFRKRLPAFNGSCQVHLIEPEAQYLPEALGITPERYKALDDLVTKTWTDAAQKDKPCSAASIIEELSAQALHPNELWYIAHCWSGLVQFHIRIMGVGILPAQ